MLSSGMFHAEAQVGNYLKKKTAQAGNRAGKKADEEVSGEMNKKVDNEVGKAFNKLFGTDESETDDSQPATSESNEESTSPKKHSSPPSGSGSSSDDARANAMLKAMGISTEPIDVQEKYNYSGNILMTVQSWSDDGETDGEVQYKTYTTKNNSGFAMEFEQEGEGKTSMIFDYDKESMIILSDDGDTKSGMVTGYSGLADQMSEAEEDINEELESDDMEDYSAYREGLKKTGKSKKIAGYKCDEYIFDDEEVHIVMWMTDQLPADLWANMFNANAISAGSMGFYGGFVMEMDQKDKSSNDRVYTLVKEVNENQASSLSTKGYQLMSIGGMPQE